MFTVQANDTDMVDLKKTAPCVVERFQLLIIYKRVVPCVIRVLNLKQTCGSAVPSVTLLRRQRKVKVNRTLRSGEGTVALLRQFCVFSSSFQWLFYNHLVWGFFQMDLKCSSGECYLHLIDKASTDEEEETYQREKTVTYQREKTVERMGAENMIATFHQNTLEELLNNEELAAKNKLSLTFVENILGMNNWLVQNPNPNRLIVARGPARFVKENFNVGVFLFSDVVIVARKLKENRKYRVEETFDIDKNFEVSRDGTEVTFANGAKSCLVRFSELGNARMWEQYAGQCKTVFL